MPQLSAYLTFNGDCAEAMHFYAQVLGGKLEAMIKYGDAQGFATPHVDGTTGVATSGAGLAELTPEDAARVMHARLVLDEQLLMASDANRWHPYQGKVGVSLSLMYPTMSDAHRVFDTLAEGGSVIMPLQKTFWAETYGMLMDRYETTWMISGGRTTA